jgi:hypothetical protein
MLLQSIYYTQEVFPKKIMSAVFRDVVQFSLVKFTKVSEEPSAPHHQGKLMLVDFTKELTSEDVWFRNGLF